jgi:hypothetical protein
MVGGGAVDIGRAPRLRLTRRGRGVVLGFLLLVNSGAGVLLATASRAAAPDGPPPTVVVGRHDTLWGIAGRHAPDRPTWAVVAEIRDLNGLADSTVHPGDTLVLPGDR